MKNFRRILALVLAVILIVQPVTTVLADENTGESLLFIEESSSGMESGELTQEEILNTDHVETEDTDQNVQTPSQAMKQEPFEQSREVDDVVITVKADAGVFPEGSELFAEKIIQENKLKAIEEAIEEERSEEKNVAASLTYDIKVLKEGEEVEPDITKGTVKVSFALAEKLDGNSEVEIYHVKENNENVDITEEEENLEEKQQNNNSSNEQSNDSTSDFIIEELRALEETQTENSDISDNQEAEITTVTVETDSFSYYTVEFTYDAKQYVLAGNSSVKLSEIQEAVGLTGVVTEAISSNSELLMVVIDGDGKDWTIKSLKPFSTSESLTITISSKIYEIRILDSMPVSETIYWGITNNGSYKYLKISTKSQSYAEFSGSFDGNTKFYSQTTPWYSYKDEIDYVVVGGTDDIVVPLDTSNWFAYMQNVTFVYLEGINTGNVIDMTAMFLGCKNLSEITNLNSLDTANVVYMSEMFRNCSSFTELDLTNFVTPKLKYMNYIFSGCSNLKYLYMENINTTGALSNMVDAFDECTSLFVIQKGENTLFSENVIPQQSDVNILGADGFWYDEDRRKYTPDEMGGVSESRTFIASSLIKVMYWGMQEYTLYIRSSEDSICTNKFYGESHPWSAGSVYSVKFGGDGDTIAPTNMSGWFQNAGLETFNSAHLDTSNVTDMSYLFSGCRGLQTLNLCGFDLSNVKSMSHMFSNTKNLACIYFSNSATSSLEDTSYMFYGTGARAEGLNLDTSKVRDMSYMYYYYYGRNSGWDWSTYDLSNIEDMTRAFSCLSGPSESEYSSYDFIKLPAKSFHPKKASHLFDGDVKEIDLGGFDTSELNSGEDDVFSYYASESDLKKVIIGEKFNCLLPSKNWYSYTDGLTYTNSQIQRDRKGIADTYATYLPSITFYANGGTGTTDPQMIVLNGETVINENQFTRTGYVFTKWNTKADGTGTSYFEGQSVSLADSLSLYAQWEVERYTVTWKNYDGTVLEIDECVPYGMMPTYDGADPTKAPTAQYVYIFTGWTPDVSTVSGDLTYVAKYNQEIRGYTITWKNYDGSTLKIDENVPYGTVIKYDGPEPYKPYTKEKEYRFDYWWQSYPSDTLQKDLECIACFFECERDNNYLTFSANGSFLVSVASKSWNGVIEVSTEKDQYGPVKWREWDGSSINSNDENTIYFRGYDNYHITYYGTGTWQIETNDDTEVSITGDIESLRGRNPKTGEPTTGISAGCYWGMFEDCKSLVSAPTLSASEAVDSMYFSMFSGCSKLKDAPALPAVTLGKSCYEQMFYECTSLTTAPVLPATTLADFCYSRMFSSCRSLTTAPELPAMTLARGCYSEMFEGCTSLTTAPELPAMTLASGCYSEMFESCTSLTKAPELPAMTLASECYSGMFEVCDALKEAPALPATTLADFCYSRMFSSCRSLTTAPELPATVMESSCYEYMFFGCHALKEAPALPATTLADSCYSHMFSTCSSLTTAPALSAKVMEKNCYAYMFNYCGYLIEAPELSATTLSEGCYSCMFAGCRRLIVNENIGSGYSKTWSIPEDAVTATDWNEGMFSGTGGTFTGSPSVGVVYYVKGDTKYTVTFKNDDGTILQTEELEYGKTPEYKGETPAKQATKQHSYTFKGWDQEIVPVTETVTYTATFEATLKGYTVVWKNYDGTVLEIDENVPYGATPSYDGDTPYKAYSENEEYYFLDTWTPQITNVTGDVGYTAVFGTRERNKNYITFTGTGSFSISATKHWEQIEVSNKTDAYGPVEWKVWNGSTVLSGTDNKLYFRGTNNSIISGLDPWVISADTDTEISITGDIETLRGKGQTTGGYSEMGSDCYARMFKDCTNIVSAPTLSAEALDTQCYQEMFAGCVNLKAAPELPATTLKHNCYAEMFKGCASLSSAPVLSSTKLAPGCYASMFSGCTALENAPALNAVTLAPYCYAHMFEYCTMLETTPVLPATVMCSYCYIGMFTGCSSITDVPAINATELADFCFHSMFLNCSSLKVNSNAETKGYRKAWCIDSTVTGAEQWNSYMFTGTTGGFTGDPSIGTTYYVKGKGVEYTITWDAGEGKFSDETTTKTSLVEIGEVPVAPEEPVREATKQYSYTFKGWDQEIVPVTETVTYTATFEAILNKYTITWQMDDGSLIDTTEAEYGTIPTHANPTKESTEEYDYSFTGWDPEIESVSGETTYRATFKAEKRTYTVIWRNFDGKELEKDAEVEYGTLPTYDGETPEKPGTQQYSYTFDGWDPEVTEVTEKAIYTARYRESVNQYTITFRNEDGTVLQEEEVSYGAMPEYKGATPTKASTAQYSYVFNGWNETIVTVTEAATYTATYTVVVNKYDVTVTVNHAEYGRVSKETVNVPYGTAISAEGADLKVGAETVTAIPAEATQQYSYSFKEWTGIPEIGKVTGDTEVQAVFERTVNEYEISWIDGDGNTLKTEKVAYGTVPVYTGEKPTKKATAQYTYEWNEGWDKEVVAVTKDETYTAAFNSTVNKYYIRFQNEDKTILQLKEFAYGETPTYEGEEPIKAPTAEYTYTWTGGWDKEVIAVTGAATYTATYNATVNKYQITWKDGDGKVLKKDSVAYGTVPEYTGATPTKTSTAQYTYTWTGDWDKEVVAVTEATTYTATFSSTLNKYTITWQMDDGSLIDTTEAEYGTIPTHADPTKASTAEYDYSFSGWNPEVSEVTGPATYKATFDAEKRTYTVLWRNYDGKELEKDVEVEYGTLPSYDGETPEKPGTQQYSYTFDGWDPEVTEVTEKAIYTAKYKESVNQYKITFKNDDGTVLQEEEVSYGEMPEYKGATPTKASTAQYSYVFNGWNETIVTVTEAATYTATYTVVVNKYDVTVTVNHAEYGRVSKETVNVPYGTAISAEDVELKVGAETVTAVPAEATQQYSYRFKEWTGIPEIGKVTGDTEVQAVFERTVNEYEITWKDGDGNTLKTEEVAYGTMPAYTGEDPTKTATAQYTYTWNGKWDKEIAAVTEDATYTATFNSTLNKYFIRFQNEDKTILQLKEFAYGEIPVYEGEEPVKAPTAEYTYTWTGGWDKEVTAVTGVATYTATYDATVNKYQITWKMDDGSVIDTTSVEYGTLPVHEDPVKKSSAEYDYVFDGWKPEVSAVTGSATYAATFKAVSRGIKIITQPVDYTGALNSTASFTVEAEGKNLSYQWQVNSSGSKYSNLSGDSKNATLQVQMKEYRLKYTYRCVVTDENGNKVISDEVRMIKEKGPEIITQPTDYEGVLNSTAMFTIEVSGSDISYQWQVSSNDGQSFKNLSGASTGASYAVQVKAYRLSYLYRCMVKDKNGNETISNVVRMIEEKGPEILQQPQNYIGKTGTTAVFTIEAEGEGLSYEWQVSTNGGEKYNKCSGADSTTDTLSIKFSAYRSAYLYRCVVTNEKGAKTISNTVKMIQQIEITEQPKDYTGAKDSTASFTVKAEGTDLKYQWQVSTDGGTNYKAYGSTTETLEVVIKAYREKYLYRCVIKDENGQEVITDSVQLKVDAGPQIITQPTDQEGAVNTTAVFRVEASGSNLSYQWQVSTDGGTKYKAYGSTTETLNVVIKAYRTGYLYRCVITDGNGKKVITNSVKIIVK